MRALALIWIIAAFVAPSIAFAQAPSDSRRMAFVVGQSVAGEGGRGLSLQGSFRVHPRFSIQADLSYAVGFDFGEYPACPPDRVCIALFQPPLKLTADAISGQGHLVAALGTPSSRFRPYVFVGGGVASIQRELKNPVSVKTSTDPLIAVGGGADFLIGPKWGLGVEARYLRTFGDQPFDRADIPKNVTWPHIGISVSYSY